MDINFGLTSELMPMLERLFTAIMAGKILTILGLSVLTFKVLDLFLETNIAIAKQDRLSPRKIRMLILSLIIIASVVLPIIVCVSWLFEGWDKISGIGTIFLVGFMLFGNFIIGGLLKRCLEPDDVRRKQMAVLGLAFGIAISIIGSRLAYWLQTLIVGIINVAISIVRTPFIMNYVLISTILNLILSFMITKFLGATQVAGQVNVVGSLIGGIAHAIVRRKRINELKAELETESKPTMEQTAEPTSDTAMENLKKTMEGSNETA